MDNYYLNLAVYLLEDFLKTTNASRQQRRPGEDDGGPNVRTGGKCVCPRLSPFTLACPYHTRQALALTIGWPALQE